ncbi:hypothetical protein Z951_15325 [Streptomyces sp. PRh5]|nr:hypothetical protein Z951_15325 [Streptomyces sp. PRh5]
MRTRARPGRPALTVAASVTFDGLSSVPWLVNAGGVHVTVRRIPDQAPLGAPQVVYDQNVSASGGSITVPFTFQGAHDAFSVYLTPASSGSGAVDATRTWASHGEGPTKVGGGSFSGPVAGKPQDIRFTRSRDNKVLYATWRTRSSSPSPVRSPSWACRAAPS